MPQKDGTNKTQYYGKWITDLKITTKTAKTILDAARARWKIENECFNTLKNHGYNIEHNYGHGQQYLSSTLAGLMLLAFLTDQLQQHACQLYKTVRKTLCVQKSWLAEQYGCS